jgi:hypothetical protein
MDDLASWPFMPKPGRVFGDERWRERERGGREEGERGGWGVHPSVPQTLSQVGSKRIHPALHPGLSALDLEDIDTRGTKERIGRTIAAK